MVSFDCLPYTCDIERLVLIDPFRNVCAHYYKHNYNRHAVALHQYIDITITKVIFSNVVLNKHLGKAKNSRSEIYYQNAYQQFVHDVSPCFLVP